MENETSQRPVFVSPNEACLWLAMKVKKKLACGKSVLEASLYEGSPLWWAVHTELALYFSGRLVNVGNPRKNISAPKAIMQFLELIDQAGTAALAKAIVLIQAWKKTGSGKKVIFFTYEKGWRNTPDPKTGKMVEGDFHYNAIINEILKRGYDINAVTVAPLWRLGFWISAKEAFKRALKQSPMHLPLENFWDFGVYSRQKEAKTEFSGAWSEINSDHEFWKTFNVEGKDFGKEARDISRFFFVHHFQKIVKTIELFERLIEKERPALLVILNHGGWYWKALLIAARAKGVKVLSTQHAAITEDASSYFNYAPLAGSKFEVQLPDIFAAHGKWTKRLLIEKWGYKKSMMRVTGQPRYDFMNVTSKNFRRNDFLLSLGLDPAKKCVVFATKIAIPPSVDDEKMIFRALGKIQKSTGIGVIVKPHPRGNSGDYEKIAREQGVKAKVIGENSVFYEAVLASDLLISLPSSVITEALMLDRAAMLIDFERGAFNLPWVESKVVVPLSRKKGIDAEIKRALFDNAFRERLRVARRKFVYEHCFLQDSKAAKRVADLIAKMLDKT